MDMLVDRPISLRGAPAIEVCSPALQLLIQPFAHYRPWAHIARLQQDWQFYVWDTAAQVVRWMTAYDTTDADVDTFVADVWRTAPA